MKSTCSLLLILFFVAVGQLTAGVKEGGDYYEGTIERDGICYNYQILVYYTTSGRHVKILEQECGFDCWEKVYEGSMNVYAGPYTGTLGFAGLPFWIGSGGNGYVTVPFGSGGLLHPSANPSCDIEFAADSSATVVISGQFLSGIVFQ